MTVPATPRKAGPYVGTGSVDTYSFDFKVLDPNHIAVIEADDAGAETTLTPASDYLVTLNDDQEATPGGTVTRTAGPLPVGYRWAILSDTPFSQPIDLPPGGPFSAKVVEDGFDNIEMQIQQLAEDVSRAVQVPPTSSVNPDELVADLYASEAAAIAAAADAQSQADAVAAAAANAAVGNGGRYSAIVGGTANAITLSPSPALGAYVTGEAITFKVASTNTGPVTVDVSGLGAKEVTKSGAPPLAAGELKAGQMVTLRYDGTRYQVITPAVGTLAAKNTNDNLTLGTNSLTTGDGTGPAAHIVNGAAGTTRQVLFQSGGVPRALIGVNNEDESGDGAGSNLFIQTYGDNGGYKSTPFTLRRSDNAMLLGSNPAGGYKGANTTNIQSLYVQGDPINPQGVAKAWVTFVGSGTVTILDSFNVTSVTDNGVGSYTLNFSSAMPNVNYAIAGMARDNDIGGNGVVGQESTASNTTSSCPIKTAQGGGGGFDSGYVAVVILGD